MGGDGRPDFDVWLTRQLRQRLDQERGPRPASAEARYNAVSGRRSHLAASWSGMLATLGTRAAIGGAVVVLAAGAAGGAVATGSLNPVTWGRHVVEVVRACQEAPAPSCAGAGAREHGGQEPAQHGTPAEQADGHGTSATPPGQKPGQRTGQEPTPSPGVSPTGSGSNGSDHGRAPGGPPSGRPTSPAGGPPTTHGSPEPTPHGHGQPAPIPSKQR